MKRSISTLLAIFMMLIIAGQVYAQTQQSTIYNQAVADYDFQIDQYRKAYAEYLLKREQFESIDSFANQEEFVIATRTMLLARGKVYEVYWQALKTLLVATESMNPALREEFVSRLVENQNLLIDHQNFLQQKTTIEELMGEAYWLNLLQKANINTAYQIILNVKLAKFNYALTQLEGYLPILKENVTVQVRNQQEREVKERGIGEVQDLLEEVRSEFDIVVNEFVNKDKRNYESSHDEMAKSLKPTYEKMKRAQGLLAELSQGTEL
jgi:hypothetical protein